MSARPKLRIAPGPGGVSIWSGDLFGEAGAPRLREFVSRAFSVDDVAIVDIRNADGFGRISYRPAAAPESVWRRLAQALRQSAGPDDIAAGSAAAFRGQTDALGVSTLYLDHPSIWPVRISRVGRTLSTWRLRPEGDDGLRLSHPVLQRRRGVSHRLEEKLAAIFGIEDVRSRSFSSDVLVRFDPQRLTPERLARELEKAWPALIDGDEPPSAKRLFAAGTLLTLAAAGQFAVPALRPFAVGAVVVYSAPNVAAAVRQLRRRQIGLPALYSFGLALMLLSGLPLTGTIMASLMQLWPYLTHRTLTNRQRRLFGAHRRRPVWARAAGAESAEIEVHVDDLKPGDEVVARAGEVVPVDGVAVSGLALVADGLGGVQDVAPGDPVYAGATLCDGELVIRVERAGEATAAAHIGAVLPHAAFRDLPSLFEAERVANRNAKPALALAALNLLTVRAPRFSQAVIRPDYVTAPRVSAQLSALYDLAEGLRRGLLFRRPAALDVLSEIDVVVFDDGAGLARRAIEVAGVDVVAGRPDDTLAYAAAALASDRSGRAKALAGLIGGRAATAHALSRRAGAVLFQDDAGESVSVVSPAYLNAAKIALPAKLQRRIEPDVASALWPLVVLRGGRPIGIVTFRRRGAPEARAVVAELTRQHPKTRFVHISSGRTSTARAAADAAGIEFAFGRLDARGKASVLKGLGRRTIWVGDGHAEDAATVMGASDVSVSVAGLAGAPGDEADVLLLRGELEGLTALKTLAGAHRGRLKDDYRAVYAANLVGVAGAFLANFGSLQSGLLSNLGSGLVYARHVRRLNRLIAEIEDERGRLTR